MNLLIMIALAGAQAGVSSAYSELTECEAVDGDAPVNELCDGYAGWDVHISASEHSASLAYSDRAMAEQFMQNPVTGGLDQSFSRTIEWRVRAAESGDGGWTPFATIHRWTATSPVFDPDTGMPSGDWRTEAEVLVVSALREEGPIGACHAAYIDVQEVYDANTVARAFADSMADEFRCGIDQTYQIGAGEAARLMERGRL
jgi:hypothetical protein